MMRTDKLINLLASRWFIGVAATILGAAATFVGSSFFDSSSSKGHSQGYSSTSEERDSVQRAAENAIDAVGVGDWQKFRDMTCGKAHEDMNNISPAEAKRQSEIYLTTRGRESLTDFTTTLIDGNHALVVASATFAPTQTQPKERKSPILINMEKHDDVWKVCLYYDLR